MRFRLLRRRLTVSAPRVAIRNDLPWPLRWALIALMVGFSAAIALWAFEFGKGIAGLDRQSRAELEQLRAEVAQLRQERERAQSVLNTSDSLRVADKAAQERLMSNLRQLEAENRALREDLGFFEQLMPSGNGGLSIRRLQAELQDEGHRLHWQALVMQPQKSPAEFNGKLELTLSGLQNGKPWSYSPPAATALQLRQYRRLEGVLDLPPQTVVKTLTAKVLEGATVRASQSFSF